MYRERGLQVSHTSAVVGTQSGTARLRIPKLRSSRCERVGPTPAMTTGSPRAAITAASNEHHSRNWYDGCAVVRARGSQMTMRAWRTTLLSVEQNAKARVK